jgi:hypothetical protein
LDTERGRETADPDFGEILENDPVAAGKDGSRQSLRRRGRLFLRVSDCDRGVRLAWRPGKMLLASYPSVFLDYSSLCTEATV